MVLRLEISALLQLEAGMINKEHWPKGLRKLITGIRSSMMIK
jgi:hypothetical protein